MAQLAVPATLALSLALACRSGASPESDASPDGSSPADTADSGPTDTGTAPSLEVGPWMCPERTESPADFVSFKVNNDQRNYSFPATSDLLRELRALAEGHVDAACLEGCDDASCEVQGCVTAAGATVDYELSVVLGDFSSNYGQESLTELTILVVADGEPWNDFRFAYVDDNTGSESEETWNVSWSGTLDPRWPADASFSAEYTRFTNDYRSSVDRSWDDGDCVWSFHVDDYIDTYYSMSVNGQSASIEDNSQECGGVDYAEARLGGYPVGTVDAETWEYISCI